MWEYKARLDRVVDGDTVDLVVDVGFKIEMKLRFRMLGINTPERGEDGFDEATNELTRLFAECDNEVRIKTAKTGKFGRWLAMVWQGSASPHADGPSINELMVSSGHAVPY